MAKQNNMLQTVLILIAGFLVIYAIITILAISKEPVTFSIQLNQKDIPRGVDGVLTYSIKNYGFTEIKNIAVGTEINNSYDNQFASREFSNFGFLQGSSGAYVFKTQNLPRGSYLVSSVLSYYDSSGKNQRKPLSLTFNII